MTFVNTLRGPAPHRLRTQPSADHRLASPPHGALSRAELRRIVAEMLG